MEKYTERLTFRLDPETIRKLKYLANIDMSSLGRILRILIDNAYQVSISTDSGKREI